VRRGVVAGSLPSARSHTWRVQFWRSVSPVFVIMVPGFQLGFRGAVAARGAPSAAGCPREAACCRAGAWERGGPGDQETWGREGEGWDSGVGSGRGRGCGASVVPSTGRGRICRHYQGLFRFGRPILD